MILADSDVWIDYLNDASSQTGEVLEDLLANDRAGLAGIVLAELVRGTRTEDELTRLDELLGGVPYLEMSRDAWRQAGRISQALDARGEPIPPADVILAGQALAQGHELLTRDRHFQRIPGLRFYRGA